MRAKRSVGASTTAATDALPSGWRCLTLVPALKGRATAQGLTASARLRASEGMAAWRDRAMSAAVLLLWGCGLG